jgi:hypothetical protein
VQVQTFISAPAWWNRAQQIEKQGFEDLHELTVFEEQSRFRRSLSADRTREFVQVVESAMNAIREMKRDSKRDCADSHLRVLRLDHVE